MFRKSYFYYAFVIVIAIAIISISSCEKDEVFEEDLAAITHHKIKAAASSLSRIKNDDPKLFNYFSQRAFTGLKSGNTGNGAILDTSYIQILEGTDYKNYIFRVMTDSTNTADVLKNYMLVILKDSIQQQFMVTYPYVNQVVDTTSVLIEPVFGTDILNQFTLQCGGGSFQSVWIPGSTVSYPCASGRHVFSQGTACYYWEKPGEARVVYTAGYFITQYVEQQPCETIGTGSSSNGGGGANVNNPNPPPDDPNDEDEDEPNMEIGITPNEEVIKEEDPECDYLKELLADTDFKRRLTRMISSATDDNIELIHEYTQSLNDSTLIFNADQGNDVNPTAPVRNLPNTILRPIIVHSHYKGTPDRSTASMFSYGDILTFTLDVFKVNLRGKDTKKMTSILVSSSDAGINIYAIKKDPNSTIANDYNLHQVVRLQMTQEQQKKERDKYKELIISKKTDQNALELIALTQLKKMGLQLYKSTDSHNNWEQLTLDPNPTNSAKPQKGTSIPCN